MKITIKLSSADVEEIIFQHLEKMGYNPHNDANIYDVEDSSFMGVTVDCKKKEYENENS